MDATFEGYEEDVRSIIESNAGESAALKQAQKWRRTFAVCIKTMKGEHI